LSNGFVKVQKYTREFDAGTIKSVVITDRGNVRSDNEDVGLFLHMADEKAGRKKGYLMLVADGMGGHNAGEVASRMAADIISQEYFRLNNTVEKSLVKAFRLANRNILASAASETALSGMGTTCTALVIIDSIIYYAHVGDSRAYLLKNDEMYRLTEDHTYVRELLIKGEISVAEASTHPMRNLLTNALGTSKSLRVDAGKLSFLFEEKNRLMICSDGLCEHLNDSDIAQLSREGSLYDAASGLVEEAKKRGGRDNITVVMAEKHNITMAPQ
jgi:PPM family protein phosphatase